MRTRDNIFTQVLVRNNRTTSDAFITETNLKDWFRDAVLWASGYKKWPFTEGRVETTFTTGVGADSDEYSFEGYKSDSFRIVLVGGKRLRKLNFEDYKIFREEEPDSSERVFSDFGRTVFINPKIDASGTLVAYGQYQPAIDVTDEAGITPFSDWDEEGNEGIVEKMTGYLKRREHLENEAEAHDQRASLKLEELWKKILAEQHGYQTHVSSGGMWQRVSVLDGGYYDDNFKRNQF